MSEHTEEGENNYREKAMNDTGQWKAKDRASNLKKWSTEYGNCFCMVYLLKRTNHKKRHLAVI